MKQEQLNRILRLVNKTGDKFIVADQETDGVFVVMDMLDYEEMQGIYDEEDDMTFEPDEDDDDDLDALIPDFGNEDDVDSEGETKDAKSANISLNNEFSPDFSPNIETLSKKDDFVDILEEKEDFQPVEVKDEIPPELLKKQNETPSFTPLSQLLRNKDFSKEEPILEEINPMEELNGIYDEVKEETLSDDLVGEDRDRFYLEPV